MPGDAVTREVVSGRYVNDAYTVAIGYLHSSASDGISEMRIVIMPLVAHARRKCTAENALLYIFE